MKTNHTSCIVCGQPTVELFLDLGSTPLANKFLASEQLAAPEPAFPLRVGFCYTCHHVQLTEGVPPGARFEDYLSISSASDTLKAHLFDLSDIVTQRYELGKNHLVIDVGCNGRTLLSGFKRHGVRTLGVDPAKNLATFTDKLGIDRHIGFSIPRRPKRSGKNSARRRPSLPPIPSRTSPRCRISCAVCTRRWRLTAGL